MIWYYQFYFYLTFPLLFLELIMITGAATGHQADGSRTYDEWGVVLVDYNPTRGNLFYRITTNLARLYEISPHVNVELWVYAGTLLPAFNTVQKLQVRQLHIKVRLRGIEEQTYGYISKAYALLNTGFSLAFFFDSDVWFCHGWEQAIDALVLANPHSKVYWTTEDCPFCDYKDRSSIIYASKEIAPFIEKYKRYTERNTGTLLGIRKCNETQEFLTRTIDIWHEFRSRLWQGTDQSPFREASFIDRHAINEKLASRKTFCRSRHSRDDGFFYYDGGPNECSCGRCSIVHYGPFFDKCILNMTQGTYFKKDDI